MNAELAVPTARELEAFSPADRWDFEETLDEAQGFLREFNDEELRRWVEVEGKTQAEIAGIVGRSQQRISQRCSSLGLVSGVPSRGGRPRVTSPSNSNGEVVEAEIVSPSRPRRPAPDGPAHHLPDVMADDALENLRTQALRWFEQGLVVKELLDNKRPLEPRSAEDRKAIKREAAAMGRVAHRLKEVCR